MYTYRFDIDYLHLQTYAYVLIKIMPGNILSRDLERLHPLR